MPPPGRVRASWDPGYLAGLLGYGDLTPAEAACAARAGAAAGLGAMAAARVARDDAPGGLVDVGSVAEVTIPPVAAGLCSSLSVFLSGSAALAPLR